MKSHVQFTKVEESNALHDVLSWGMPALAVFAVWMFLVRRFAHEERGPQSLNSYQSASQEVA